MAARRSPLRLILLAPLDPVPILPEKQKITDLSQENAYSPKMGMDCKGLHITTVSDKLLEPDSS